MTRIHLYPLVFITNEVILRHLPITLAGKPAAGLLYNLQNMVAFSLSIMKRLHFKRFMSLRELDLIFNSIDYILKSTS